MSKTPTLNWYILLFLLTFGADRITKYSALQTTNEIALTPWLSCNLIFNRGISWSLFHAADDTIFWAVTLVVCCIVGLFLAYTIIRYLNHVLIPGEILVLSGALSNLVDRFAYHGVIDFLHIACNRFQTPIFNLADIFIVVGIGIMALTTLRET